MFVKTNVKMSPMQIARQRLHEIFEIILPHGLMNGHKNRYLVRYVYEFVYLTPFASSLNYVEKDFSLHTVHWFLIIHC